MNIRRILAVGIIAGMGLLVAEEPPVGKPVSESDAKDLTILGLRETLLSERAQAEMKSIQSQKAALGERICKAAGVAAADCEIVPEQSAAGAPSDPGQIPRLVVRKKAPPKPDTSKK